MDRLDPSIDKIVPAGAIVERIVTGFTWIEGPVWADGRLFFAEIPSNSIRTWTPGQGVSVFLQLAATKAALLWRPRARNEWDDARRARTPDSCRHAQRDVSDLSRSIRRGRSRFLPTNTKQATQQSQRSGLQVGWLALLHRSAVWLAHAAGQRSEKQLAVNGVYRIPHALEQKPGAAPARAELQLLVSDLTRPNGIAFSPDEKYLYVNNSLPKKIWMRYRVMPDGTLTDAKLLFDDTADTRPVIPTA